MQPKVSVVMATYNRSNIIGYAIDSLIRGSYQNWELIVVGDCCTDDTEAVVKGIGDPRIRFVNLDENFGEQTGPNNAGVALASGTYLAFLNHDDLWLPDHLERCVALLERGEADLVCAQGLLISGRYPPQLVGACCGEAQAYQPWMPVPATLWVMRRELAERVGPWQPSWELRVMPSQAWLYRAYRRGERLLAIPFLGAIIINSGDRANSYRDRQEAEHRQWHARLAEPGLAEALLAGMLGRLWQQKQLGMAANARNLAVALVRRFLLAFGVWPPSMKYWLKFWRKGAFLQSLHKVRGLEADRGQRTTRGKPQ